MRLSIDPFLDTSTHTSRCLAAVVLATPFMCMFWAGIVAALFHPEMRPGIRAPYVLNLAIGLALSIVLNVGLGQWLWPRRHQSERLVKANLLVALNIGVAYVVLMISFGAFTTAGNLVLLGVMAIGMLLFDQRTMLIAFCVCLSIHLSVDLLVMMGHWPYAPALSSGTFSQGEPIWWWSVWRSFILFLAWAVLLPLIFILFGRLDTLHAKLDKLSYTDMLTGLANRRFFMERLQSEAQRQHRTDTPFCLVLLDADHFKRVNDRFGHAAGDEVLRHLADTLVAAIRTPTDQSARLGGEEFGVLLPDTSLEAAAVVCQRVASAIAAREFHIKGERFHVTVSMGVVECRHADIEAALKQADLNLYQAKDDGRNAIVYSAMAGGRA